MTNAEVRQHKSTSGVRLALSMLKVSFGSLAALLTGLVGQVVVAGLFGSGIEMDAFLTAMAVPTYLQALLWSLSFVVVPDFVKEESSGREDDAWALVGTIICLVGGALIALSAAGIAASSSIIAVVAPGLSPSKSQLTADMLAILIVTVPFSVLGTLAAGVQNARGRFLWPALAPAVGSMGNLAVVLVGKNMLGPAALAWGALVSASLQALVTLAPVLRHGWTYLIPLNDRRLWRIAKLIAPFLLFGIVSKANPVLERFFASGLPDGQLSFLGYANKVAHVVSSVISAPIATAIFPAMAKEYAIHGKAGLAALYSQGLRLALAIGLPILAILSVLSLPAISVLLERGRFDRIATSGAAAALPYLLLVVVCGMLGNIIGRTLYVQGKTVSYPLVSGLGVLAYPLVVSLLLPSMGYMGLARASALVNSGVIVAGLMLVRRELGPDWPRGVGRYGLFALVGALAASFASGLPPLASNPFGALVVGGITGVGIYTALLLAFDNEVRLLLYKLVRDIAISRLPTATGEKSHA